MAPSSAVGLPRANIKVETTLTGLRPVSTTKRAAAAAHASSESEQGGSSQQYLLGCAYVEVLGTQGAQPLANWKLSGPPKALQKVCSSPDCSPYAVSVPRRKEG